MKKHIFLFIALCFLTIGHIHAQNTITVMPAGKMERAVSGHFAGIVDGKLKTWGGCNFPDVPCADGGQKVFYPKAYGASVQVPGETIYIGGMNENGSDKTVSPASLPPLPKPLDNFAACYGVDRIFVAGGQTNGVPNKDVFALDWPDGKEWVKLCELPDDGRLQPCMAVQNAPEGKALYVFGGFLKDVYTYGLKLNLKSLEWTKTSPTAGQALVGSCCTPCGYSHILFFGGVDYDIFLSAIQGKQDSLYLRHEPSWYKFRSDVLAYHTITDSWTTIKGDTALARAGAALTPFDGGWYYSGGETMPGIRSDKISRIETKHETHFGWLNWTVLILYLVAMLGMGIYFMKRENGAEDFFKGGGRIPWWAAGISIYATMLSAITYMAIPAKAYATDWTYYPMLWMIPVVGFPVIWYYLPYFRRLKAASAYAILEERFNLATRMMASTLFCIFMVARMALVMYLPSLALTAVTGIDIYLCIVLMGLVTIIYCTMGGVEAVIWGDVVQGCILVGGAIFAAVYLWAGTEGGFAGAWQIAVDNDKMRMFVWSLDYRRVTFWVAIIGGGIANNLISYTSDQTVIQRYMTTKDEKSAGRSILVNGFMSVFISVAFYFIGTGLYTFYKTHPQSLDITMQHADAIFPYFMMSQMPAGIAGLLIAAIFAATMSTISSNINSVSTAFSVDFVQRFRPRTTDAALLRVARWTCVVSGLIGLGIALLMATWDIASLLDYFNTILGLLTSGLGGLFVMAVFFPRIKGRAALTGFIAGELVVFLMYLYTDVNFFLFGATGIVVSVLVALMLSQASPLPAPPLGECHKAAES
ncbi:MAG: sodium/solute symporter [Bacteroidaceae bacterium]|nr:sodium/solute symporter [Bacteroidaceae bacterium]MBQ8455633.1 sodium/solute symporter [Bacteroidaceae bacterium]